MKKVLPTTILTILFLTLATPCQAALPTWDPTGDDIVCNPRQGVRRLYGLGHLEANGQYIECSGEVFVLWSQIEPQEGEYDWTALDEKLDEAVRQNKETSFALGISGNSLPGYQAEMPSWVFEAMQEEANLCCNGITWLGTRYTPVPWNTTFQEKLTNILTAARDHIKANPDYDRLISAVIPYCGGPWGEMNLCMGAYVGCHGYGSWEEWTNAGYTHERFANTVLDLIGIYMDLFPDKPCALQLGNGMFWGDPTNPSQSRRPADIVKAAALARYGTRVILKFNGFGPNGTTPDMILCQNHYCSAESAHRYPEDWCWYEGGTEVCGPEDEDQYFDRFLGSALGGGLQWYGPNWDHELASNPNSFIYFARHAGAQIMNLETAFPATIQTGTAAGFSFQWFNRGNFPLFKTRLEDTVVGGITYQKGFPTSYKIFVDLVDGQGQTAYHTTFTPNPPTLDWVLPDGRCLGSPGLCNPYNPDATPDWIKQKGPVIHNVAKTLDVPLNISSGEYEVRIGLSDPHDDTKRWNLVNTTGNDGTARYGVGTITVTSNLHLASGVNKITWPTSPAPNQFSALLATGTITHQEGRLQKSWTPGFSNQDGHTETGKEYLIKQ